MLSYILILTLEQFTIFVLKMASVWNFLKFILAKPFCVFVLANVVLVQFSLGENSDDDFKSNKQLTCGRVISSCANGGNELFVGYKYNKPVDKWERCSWIIAIPNATTYTLEPVLNGLKTQAAGLVVLGISDKDELVSYNL